MTVSELIEELQKFPPHHRVFVEFGLDGGMDLACGTDWSSMVYVRADAGCSVIIDATRGVE